MIKKIHLLLSTITLLMLCACASNRQEDETMARIRAELEGQGSPLTIHENRQLNNANTRRVFKDDSQAKDVIPTFESERATGNVVNTRAQRPARPATKEAGTVTLNFENADLREVVKFIMTDLLEQNYILSPVVQGQVTLQTSEPIAKSDCA